MSDIRIYRARKIITMNPRRATASHVAVRDGLVLGTGDLDDLTGWGDCELDDRFADKVIMPGMIEGHSHGMEGGVWEDHYTGFYDRKGPDGKIHPALKSIDEVVSHLQKKEAEMDDPDKPLLAWGFDPIYFDGPRMSKEDLDKVSTTRPVLVIHASFHIINVNSVVLDAANITGSTNVMGIDKNAKGEPSGELQGQSARYVVFESIGRNHFEEYSKPDSMWRFARSAQLAGVTTATDLSNQLDDTVTEQMAAMTKRDDYPLRIIPAFASNAYSNKDGLAQLQRIASKGHDKFRIGLVKMVADGSIQGFTARMKDPGYYNGHANGLWYIEPDQIQERFETYHSAGFQVHIHTNGDQATEVVLQAIEGALRKFPDGDPRITLQHCQMAHEAHYRKMASLGVCANVFSNHLFYWGDQHYNLTMGPERAERMNGAATAKRLGVPFAIHSDAPITPLAPLFTAWCAVNRLTASGRVLGEAEKISVEDALFAITLGAAYTLKLDRELGSIETGKRADFAILEQDPLGVDPMALKDVPVWGTVLGGKVFANEDIG
jgi:predicted amidohydrolase YtcJ